MRCLSAIFALAAVTIILVSSTLPASAGLVSAEDFQVIESVGSNGNGYYSVINNSDDEYIYAFSVTNPLARSVGDWTSEKGWTAGKTPLLGGPKDGFWYGTLPGIPTFSRHHLGFLVNPATIAAGEHSSNFFFGTDQLASIVTLYLVDEDGKFSTTTFTAAVPEPSTWAMMILGFVGLGLVARYRRRTALLA
jgi:PEP-CTERM motif-containing protein